MKVVLQTIWHVVNVMPFLIGPRNAVSDFKHSLVKTFGDVIIVSIQDDIVRISSNI